MGFDSSSFATKLHWQYFRRQCAPQVPHFRLGTSLLLLVQKQLGATALMNCTYNVFLVEKSFQLTFTSTEPQHINTISTASLQNKLKHTANPNCFTPCPVFTEHPMGLLGALLAYMDWEIKNTSLLFLITKVMLWSGARGGPTNWTREGVRREIICFIINILGN